MKSFKQHINEVLDKPYKLIKSIKGGYGSQIYEYDFYTKDRRLGTVMIEYDTVEENADIQFEVARTKYKTDSKGDQFRIFATVRAAVEEFLKNNDPYEISFSGSKDNSNDSDSRMKLYKTFATKLAKKYKYDLKTYSNTPTSVVFELSRGIRK